LFPEFNEYVPLQAKLVVIAQEQQAAEIREIRGDIVKVGNMSFLRK